MTTNNQSIPDLIAQLVALANRSSFVPSGRMPRITQEKIRDIALRILDAAAQEGRTQRVAKRLDIRLALACLAHQSDGDRDPFDGFWFALQVPDDLARQIALDRSLLGIRYQLGLIDETTFIAAQVALPVRTKKGYR